MDLLVKATRLCIVLDHVTMIEHDSLLDHVLYHTYMVIVLWTRLMIDWMGTYF